MAKTKKKPAKKKAKAASISPDLADIQKREATRKRLLGTIMDARDKKERHTNEAASLAARRQEEMKEANRWEKVETEAIEDILKIDGGGFVDRLPFDAAPSQPSSPAAPQSPEGQTVVATAGKSAEMAHQDAFDAISIDALPTIKGACKDKLLAEGIRTGAELRKWRNDRFAKKISGIGESALQVIDDAMADWFIKNPVKAAAAAPVTKPAKQTPDSVVVSKIEIIASVTDLFSVYVAPRESGKLCYGFWIKNGKLPNLGEFEQDYFGHYEAGDRDKLYRDALDACTAKVKELEQGGLIGPKEREACSKIHLAIIEAGKLVKKAKKAAVDSGESIGLSFAN